MDRCQCKLTIMQSIFCITTIKNLRLGYRAVGIGRSSDVVNRAEGSIACGLANIIMAEQRPRLNLRPGQCAVPDAVVGRDPMKILDGLEKLLMKQDLSREETSEITQEILSGEASPIQEAAFLVALAMKGETEAELLGVASVLRGKTYFFNQHGPVEVGLSSGERRLLLGSRAAPGDGAASTFNISTAVALTVAGAGAHVLQQGYRSQDWGLESSGVLEALGINTRIPVWKIDRSVAEVGVGFVFEPVISEVMGCLQFAFREIPVPTVFDLTLPLLNPGGAAGLVVGIHSARLTETMARVVSQMGVRRGFVFHGSDGLDAITNTGPTQLAELDAGAIRLHQIQPGDFGFPVARLEELSGGDAKRNAEIITEILQGKPGGRRNVVLLNAAPAIVCAGKARDLAEGVRVAAEAIDSGRAAAVLEKLAAFADQKT
jgi:anthranilate phosphoribosyltransferase